MKKNIALLGFIIALLTLASIGGQSIGPGSGGGGGSSSSGGGTITGGCATTGAIIYQSGVVDDVTCNAALTYSPTAGVKLGSIAEVTCNVGNRGVLTMVQGGSGVADTLRVCAKDSANNYFWTALY